MPTKPPITSYQLPLNNAHPPKVNSTSPLLKHSTAPAKVNPSSPLFTQSSRAPATLPSLAQFDRHVLHRLAGLVEEADAPLPGVRVVPHFEDHRVGALVQRQILHRVGIFRQRASADERINALAVEIDF